MDSIYLGWVSAISLGEYYIYFHSLNRCLDILTVGGLTIVFRPVVETNMMVSVVIRSLLVTQRRPILVILFIRFTFAIHICALISAIFIPCDSFRSSLFIYFSFYRGVFICLDLAFLCFFFFLFLVHLINTRRASLKEKR